MSPDFFTDTPSVPVGELLQSLVYESFVAAAKWQLSPGISPQASLSRHGSLLLFYSSTTWQFLTTGARNSASHQSSAGSLSLFSLGRNLDLSVRFTNQIIPWWKPHIIKSSVDNTVWKYVLNLSQPQRLFGVTLSHSHCETGTWTWATNPSNMF